MQHSQIHRLQKGRTLPPKARKTKVKAPPKQTKSEARFIHCSKVREIQRKTPHRESSDRETACH